MPSCAVWPGLSVALWRNALEAGAELNMHEGPHVVGTAKVLRVALRPDGAGRSPRPGAA